MKKLCILVPCLLTLAACAGSSANRAPEIAAALEQLQSREDYARTERCLSTHQYRSVEVLDENHLLFTGTSRDRLWLNKLRSRCPGLRRNDTLAFELRNNRLCNLDTATVVDRFLFWERTGPTCSLGEFQQLTPGQAELLREAL